MYLNRPRARAGRGPRYSCAPAALTLLVPICPSPRPYGVDVPSMSFYVHSWDIHVVCPGTDGSGVTGVRSGVRGQVTAMIETIPPTYKPVQQPMNGTGQRQEFRTAIRLRVAPASAASMATSAGVVSCQSVKTIPKATSGMVCK